MMIFKTKKARIMNDKLIGLMLVLVAIAIIVWLYITFKETAAANLKYAMSKIFDFG